MPGGSLGDRATRGISAELDLSEPPGGPLGAKAAQSSAATTAELILELASACSAFDGVPGLRPGAIRCGPMNATSGAALVAAPSYRPDDKADTSARWRAWVWTLIWSRLFFHEPFNRSKILGLVLILIGVFFIGLGNR